jgi:hypothetical protein
MNIGDITLEELMSEDYQVLLKKSPTFGFDLYIEGDDIDEAIESKGVHPYAIESLANFCRSFLASYSRLEPSL